MSKLTRKLHSQCGASILLALLFMLVCMMAASSVLMAAVSNVGKIRSSYEEQQRYMALSSALRLVAGELEQAQYRGAYTVEKWNETRTRTEEDGSTTTVSSIDYYCVTQKPGTFTCGHLTPGTGDVLEFRKELDGVFAGKFRSTGYKPLDSVETSGLPTSQTAGTTRGLTVEVAGAGDGMFPPVAVAVDMSQGLRVHLKAVMYTEVDEYGNPGGDRYVMEAELSPFLGEVPAGGGDAVLTPGGIPSIGYSPGSRIPKNDIPSPGVNLDVTKKPPENKQTETFVTWRLDWISQGETGGAGP